MEYRSLGKAGLKVPVLSFGTATFGGTTEFFKSWGSTQTGEARRLIELCLENGVNLFDTADGYSDGAAEEILGKSLVGLRDQVLISTKSTIPTGIGPNDGGSSRHHITKALETSLRRLQTDHIDIYHMHIFDATTPIDETLRALDDHVRAGKIRYIACSNFSGWHLTKSLAISREHGWSGYVAHQIYYSLVGRDAEFDLIPAGLDQGVGTIVWSPLAGGALTGKIRREKPAPAESRIGQREFVPYDQDTLFDVVDVLDSISKETGKTISQIALNWLLQRPTISTIVVGARNEEQLKQNFGAVGWNLTPAQVTKLDAASETKMPYPNWHQSWFPQFNPPAVPRLNRK